MRKIIGLVIGLCLCFLFFSGTAAAEVDYGHTYSDGSGDVMEGTEAAYAGVVGGHDYIDITEVKSYKSEDNVILKMTVVGVITDSEDKYYYFSIYLTEETETATYGYTVWYGNGECVGMNLVD